jgi:hypothetical protein
VSTERGVVRGTTAFGFRASPLAAQGKPYPSADWRNLMDRMAAEGRDVAAASELFQTFQADLEARRSNRDLIQRLILERRE